MADIPDAGGDLPADGEMDTAGDPGEVEDAAEVKPDVDGEVDAPCVPEECTECGQDDGCGGTCGEDVLCDDGIECTLDLCKLSGCDHLALDSYCDDDNACTAGSCNPETDCQYDNVDGPCDDDAPCTSNDLCTGGECGGSGYQCNDGLECGPLPHAKAVCQSGLFHAVDLLTAPH